MLAVILVIQRLVGERRLGRRAPADRGLQTEAGSERWQQDASAQVVEFRNVTKRYGGVVAVDEVSFRSSRETLVTLLGPSGCGKTTTLRLIAGLSWPARARSHRRP